MARMHYTALVLTCSILACAEWARCLHVQDGMHNKWPEAAVHKQLEEAVARHSITKVSRHNHFMSLPGCIPCMFCCACHEEVRYRPNVM